MEIRQALLKAADSIENSGMYDFMESTVSHDCGTPMCMIGWIGFHLGGLAGKNIEDVCEACGFEEDELYWYRRQLAGTPRARVRI